MLKMSKSVSLLLVLCASGAEKIASAPSVHMGILNVRLSLWQTFLTESFSTLHACTDCPVTCILSFINQIGTRKCHTSYIGTPNGKEHAQKLAGEELTEVILKLLMAWGEPLTQFHQSMTQQQDSNIYSSSKAMEMSDMVHDLKNSVQKVAEKMQLLGILSNFLNGENSLESLDTDSSSVFFVDHLNLLHCFRRDSDKIWSYLKILKCRILPENGC